MLERRPRGYEGINHETIGSDILSFLKAHPFPALMLGQQRMDELAEIRPDGWYPIEELLDIMDTIADRVGPEGLRVLGRKLYLVSHEGRIGPELRTARDVVYGIDAMYHFANRGEHIGGWVVTRFEPGRAELDKTTPHHCHMEEGILFQALATLNIPVTIEQPECLRKGDDLCRFVIHSVVKDHRWG